MTELAKCQAWIEAGGLTSLDDFVCLLKVFHLGGTHSLWKRTPWWASGDLVEHNLIESKLRENSLTECHCSGPHQGVSKAPPLAFSLAVPQFPQVSAHPGLFSDDTFSERPSLANTKSSHTINPVLFYFVIFYHYRIMYIWEAICLSLLRTKLHEAKAHCLVQGLVESKY